MCTFWTYAQTFSQGTKIARNLIEIIVPAYPKQWALRMSERYRLLSKLFSTCVRTTTVSITSTIYLEYTPKGAAFECCYSTSIMQDIFQWNDVGLVYYKGGDVEREICKQLNMPLRNIEEFGAPEVTTHDPLEELKDHYKFLRGLNLI